MTPSHIIINLTQLFFLTKLSFVSEEKENYDLGQTWLKLISEQTVTWQPRC